MISASDVVMKTIINPAGGDIKNVHCQNDLQDAGNAQLRTCLRADGRASVSDPRGAAAADFMSLR
ncbi:hypothetical protein QF000_005688 [Paraburkholderia atlantica]|uniref:Uncharacterized protein n=2 Tax=Paraburkholderia atlantica TaxID=2654982 RepID=A0A6I1Q290_PARAM|nr:hypothetical protein [Paraburkholderia atlantica]MBB5416980.1 hypothetical protein [Paraburkholderia atlantica]MBB5427537.1 hypothetical protein [Paraburkholderia atlantica]MPW05830.1 hypothetical protein [Paraburkholderia atlantica]NUY34966.1 hypothetical protein [Paraburkholderia atlantica]